MTGFLFGTVGSPLSTPKSPGGTIGGIQRIRELGLQTLELGWVRSVRVSENTCSKIKSEAENQKIAISVHAPYFINLYANSEEWPKSRKRLMDAAYYGFLAGASDIIFHPGSYLEEPQKAIETSIKRLKECMQELNKSKVNVVMRPETMGKRALLGSLEDTLIMSKEIEGVLPCLDFAHLHARAGDGSMNTREEWKKALDDYQNALGKKSLKSLHIHLSGIRYTEKGEQEHLAIEDSDLDTQALFSALAEFECEGRILCESPILEEDALYLQKLWAEFRN